MSLKFSGHLCDIDGILVGHAQDAAAQTGCTVVLCPKGAVPGVDVRGAAPGTMETDLLRPGCTVEGLHAVLLTGGSAFGLAAAAGVREYLEQKGVGLNVGSARVPLVSGAVIFDLETGDGSRRPDAAMGYRAAEAAKRDLRQGRVGAGTGATVGKATGMQNSMPCGLGSASIRLPGGATVAAMAVVNALGDVVDPQTGRLIAGLRDAQSGRLRSTSELLLRSEKAPEAQLKNTTIAVVATDAKLSKEQVNRMATIAHDGYALAIRPCHTQMDGDTIFGLSYGDKPADYNLVLHAAAQACARAIQNAAYASGEGEDECC